MDLGIVFIISIISLILLVLPSDSHMRELAQELCEEHDWTTNPENEKLECARCKKRGS